LAAFKEFERKVADEAVAYLTPEQFALLTGELANLPTSISMQLTIARATDKDR
jgi:hypothetical protein